MSNTENPRKRKREYPHPYLSGNFAPVQKTYPLTPCTYAGTIPDELLGGEYVRNGGNPVSNDDLGRDAHWFDGDGMLSGVAFQRTEKGVEPHFVNQYILTDVYLSSRTSKFLRKPILPSIATLVNPLTSLYVIILNIFRPNHVRDPKHPRSKRTPMVMPSAIMVSSKSNVQKKMSRTLTNKVL
jgi:hypothetical protein